MPFSLVSTSTVLARNAGALYNVTLSNSLMTSLATQAGSTNAGMEALLNNIYVNSVGNATPASVAAELVANLGITGAAAIENATAYVVGVLAATPVAVRGAAVNNIISLFSQLTDATYGGFATAYNTKVTNSEAYSAATANNSLGSFSSVASVSTPSVFTLTTGIDNTQSANVNGLIDQNTAANTTWGLSDSISAVNGTVNLSLITAGANIAGYNTAGVTKLVIKPIDAANTATASSFDVGGMTGLTNVTVQNASVIGTTSDSMTIGSLPAAASVTISGNGQYQDVTANYVSAATQGTADTVTLSVTGRNGTATVGTGFETAAITGGAAARLASLTTSTVKTVNVTGSDMRIDATLDSTVTSINASTATGTVNLAATPGATFSAKGGTGTADVLAVSALTSTHSVTGFETVVATAAATYDLTGTDTTSLGVGVGAGAVSFTNASAAQNNIVVGGLQQRTTAPAATGNLTTNGSVTWALKTATGTADTLNIAANNGGTASSGTMTIGGAVTTSAVENINLAMTDWKAVTIGGNVAIAPTSTVNGKFVATGASNLSLTTNAIAFSGGLASGTDTVDLSGLTGTFTGALTMANGNLTFTGGSGVTTLTTSAPVASKTQDITTGAANDVITITSMGTTAGTTKVTAGAGDDRITLDASVAQTTTNQVITIDGGAGTDLLATVGTANSRTINATISNIETIQLEAGGAATALNFTVASGYADTVRIIDASGQTETIVFNTSSGGSVNLSKLTTVGWTSGTDILAVNSTAGNETFTFGAKSSADSAVIETYNALIQSGNGIDTIAGFTAAAGGDILNLLAFDAILNGGTSAVANITTNTTAGAANANILLLNFGTYYANAAAVVASATAQTFGSGIAGAAASVIIAYQTAANSDVRLAFAGVADTGGVQSATDFAVLTGVTTITNLNAANFVMD